MTGTIKKVLKPAKKKMGRPRGSFKLLPDEKTIAQIKTLSRYQCTQKQVAAVLGAGRVTFISFLNKHKRARAAWEMGRGEGDAALRQKPFQKATAGKVQLPIWPGKTRLGQKEAIRVGGDPGSPPISVGHLGAGGYASGVGWRT